MFNVKFEKVEDGNMHRPRTAYWTATDEDTGKVFDVASFQGRDGYHILGLNDQRHELAGAAVNAVERFAAK